MRIAQRLENIIKGPSAKDGPFFVEHQPAFRNTLAELSNTAMKPSSTRNEALIFRDRYERRTAVALLSSLNEAFVYKRLKFFKRSRKRLKKYFLRFIPKSIKLV